MDDLTTDPAGSRLQDLRVVRVAAPLRQSVVTNIRSAIALGRFRAGERLTERNLCEMTGVSRTLVREAIRQLESEGLITVLPHRGPVVARLTPEQAEGLYQVRRELEGLAAELFARNASEADQAALRRAQSRLMAAVHGSDASERLSAKNEFYNQLICGTRNEALGQTLSQLNSRITVLRATSLQVTGRWAESLKELSVLVDALVTRDALAARRAAMLHVDNAAAVAVGVLRGEVAEQSRTG